MDFLPFSWGRIIPSPGGGVAISPGELMFPSATSSEEVGTSIPDTMLKMF